MENSNHDRENQSIPSHPTPSLPYAPPPGHHLDVKNVFRRLGPVGPLAIVAATLPGIGGFVLLGTLKWTGPWLRDQGNVGVLLYSLGFAVMSGLALLPTYAQSITGGWAFKGWPGAPSAIAGIVGGSLIGYVIARRTSGDRVVKLIEEQPKWKAVCDALIGGGFWKTLVIVTLIRIPPNSPFAITNLVMGATRVQGLAYTLGTLIGIAPRTIIAVMIGAGLSNLDFKNVTSTWHTIAAVVSAVAVLAIIGAVANRALDKVTDIPQQSGG